MKRLMVMTCLALAGAPAHAERIEICYNYGCATRAGITLTDDDLAEVEHLFQRMSGVHSERDAIARAIGLLESMAGRQTPTFRDKGRNVNDDDVEGRMDCIDHAHNATAYLRLLEEKGWLRFHRVLQPARRAPLLVNEHWAAQIMEKSSGQPFVVDSWFFDNGRPAAIFTLDDWLGGAEPNG